MNSLASVIIVTYNQRRYLETCINSVLKQDYPHEIIVVDNCSEDDSVQFLKERFPEVKLIENIKNVGYGAGNNLGVKQAMGEYAVILNPDTVVEKDWLQELIKPLDNNEKIITTPKILLYDGSAINTCGNINHFTGLTFTRGLNEKIDRYGAPEFISGISGCCFAVKKSNFDELGGFDKNLFVYNEDADLSWRAHLKNFKILYVPTSKVRHDYKLKVLPEKIYHLEKNRYIILRKYFSWKDFFLLSPSLIMAEILTFGYGARYGQEGIKYKFKALKDGFSIKVNKEQGDKRELFKSLSTVIPVEQLTFNKVEKILKILANKIFELNFKVML